MFGAGYKLKRCLSADFKIFGDPLSVWGNPNFNINPHSWCISSRVDSTYKHSGQGISLKGERNNP